MIYAPIIIIGMHRSGTSLLTSMLEKLGLFVGHTKDENNEAVFFMRLNEWILSQANATWDNPYCFGFVSNNLIKQMCMALEVALKGSDKGVFLGPEKTAKYSDIQDLSIPWGWKDPRNTFTIDVWKEIFPAAKVIHIYRNPIDVAASLRKREENRNAQMQTFINKNGIGEVLSKGIKLQTSPRLESLKEGIELWSSYVKKAMEITESHDTESMSIKYEEFLERPSEILMKTANFVGLDVRYEDAVQCTKLVDSSRSYAFTKDGNLVDIYNTIKRDQLVQNLGYDAIIGD